MIDLKGTMGIPFLKKSRFTGSDGPLRFVLEKRGAESVPADALWPGREAEPGTGPAGEAVGVGVGGEAVQGGVSGPAGDCLAAVCWHGPYCSDATPDTEKTTAYFSFTKEGLAQAQEWLNAQR